MQGGGSKKGDGVSLGLTEETHGAERVAAEERSGGAQGDLSVSLFFFFLLQAPTKKLFTKRTVSEKKI